MLKMVRTAVSFIILVVFFIIPILASEWNVTNFENSSSTFISNITITAVTSMSTTTVNESDITQTYSPTTQEHPTSQKLPSPSAVHPASTLSKPTTKAKDGGTVMTTPKPQSDGSDNVGIIILIVIIIIAFLSALVCYVARSRGRRYSMDLTSRPDEAQIPLSTVEPEGLVETHILISNGLQFEGTENSTQETQEPEMKPEEQVEKKAESKEVTVDASANCATPTADNPEDQPLQDIPEQSPSAPGELSHEEKTDDEEREDDASNKTSVESLKESNEDNKNNSNSSHMPQRGAREGETTGTWNVSLDNMV